MRWRAPDGDFAVLAGVSDEGEEVVLVGRARPRPRGRVGRRRRAAGSAIRATAGASRPSAPASRSPPASRRCSPTWARSSTSGRAARAWLLERHGPEQVLGGDRPRPERALREVPGIGPARIGAAVRSWEDQGALRAVRLFLEEHGVPAAVAARIYRAYGPGAIETLRSDPYGLTELDGIGFATADALAQALGTPPDAPGRLDAGLRHALREAEGDGHCHLPRAELAERARRLLGADADDRIDELAARGRLVIEGDRVFEPGDARASRRDWRATCARSSTTSRALRLGASRAPDRATSCPPTTSGRSCAPVLEHRLAILTGGPGTGKTHDDARARRPPARRAPHGAPVRADRQGGAAAGRDHGRARRRRSTGCSSTSPARASPATPRTRSPAPTCSSSTRPRCSPCAWPRRCSRAVGPRTHVLLVGDVDQLAPVGPGRVLDDLIESGAVPVVRLTEIFRQAARSLIVRAAHAINAGEPPPTAAGAGDLRDFFVIERTGADAIRDEVVALAAAAPAGPLRPRPAGRGPRAGAHAPRAGRASTRSTPSCARRLNADGAAIPGTPLRVGDRVIQTKNNHERELMNGEMGVIEHHDAERDRVLLACDDGRRLTLRGRRARHHAPGPRGLDPQGPGLAGAGGRRRPAPRAPPDAHAQPRLHGHHARRARRAWSSASARRCTSPSGAATPTRATRA